jgi:hypothetical protein
VAAFMIERSVLKKAHSHVCANVVGYAALFVALGGTAAAATGLSRNSVGTRQIRNGAVTGKKVACHTLTGANIKASTLGTVPNSSRLGHLEPSAFQMRVAGGCAPSSAISQITAAGTVSCQTVPTGNGTITGVTAGAGLTGGGSSGPVTLTADQTVLQHRLGGSCLAGSAITSVASDGTVSCTNTSVYSEAHTGPARAVSSAGVVAFDALDASNGVGVSPDGTTYTVSTAGHYEVSVELIPASGVATNDFFILINNGQGR